MSELQAPFLDPDAVAQYADGPPRFVPGFASLHKMAGILIRERAPEDAVVLVIGAGGGLEIEAFAQSDPGWSFVGVDPAAAMLDLAASRLAPHRSRIRLQQGYSEDAPSGPFDAATCLLTLHFMAYEERRRALGEIRSRLKPGAPFVAVHSSFPQGEGERDRWLSRYAAFASASDADPTKVAAAREAVAKHVQSFSPSQDEAMLLEAGFSGVELFYAGFTFRGWVAYA